MTYMFRATHGHGSRLVNLVLARKYLEQAIVEEDNSEEQRAASSPADH
jgi:hypothetical protein